MLLGIDSNELKTYIHIITSIDVYNWSKFPVLNWETCHSVGK